MKIKVNYQNYYSKRLVGYKALFNEIADFAYDYLKLDKKYELSISIVDDETIHTYNKQYRNIDRPTDVLSFAFLDHEDNIISKKPLQLGDIIISFDTAIRQANDYSHSLRREMAFLFTHGLLHLLGYDHMVEEDEVEMFSLQDKILEGLNILR